MTQHIDSATGLAHVHVTYKDVGYWVHAGNLVMSPVMAALLHHRVFDDQEATHGD